MRNGAVGFPGAMQDLPAYTAGGSTLLVFALPRQGAPQQGAPLPSGQGTATPNETNQEQGNAPHP